MSTGDDHLRAHLSEAIAHTDPTLRDRLHTEPAAYLDLVALTARARDETDALLRLAVAGARAAGCTWEAVGGALGMTKQAAHQRFGTVDDDAAAADDGAPGGAGVGTEAAPEAVAGAGSAVDPDDPDGRIHRISWLNTFTEMKALENAGRYGWHLIGIGSGTVIVRKSDVQWEHQRVFASRSAARALEAQGWTRCCPASFPHSYYKRPTGEPALPEPADDGYLGRT